MLCFCYLWYYFLQGKVKMKERKKKKASSLYSFVKYKQWIFRFDCVCHVTYFIRMRLEYGDFQHKATLQLGRQFCMNGHSNIMSCMSFKAHWWLSDKVICTSLLFEWEPALVAQVSGGTVWLLPYEWSRCHVFQRELDCSLPRRPDCVCVRVCAPHWAACQATQTGSLNASIRANEL